jgi:peptidoglycan/LPS O-acetylase OafA/YrhL
MKDTSSNDKKPQAHKNAAIENLRGIAAVTVVVHHFLILLGIQGFGSHPNFGIFGVSVFFVISGFLIYSSFADKAASQGYGKGLKTYASSRVFRILPAYYFNFLIILLIVPFTITQTSWLFSFGFLKQVVYHIFLIPYMVYKDCGFGLNGSYWTLSIEMLWYVSVPFLFRFFNSAKKISALMLISLLYFAALETRLLDFVVEAIKSDPAYNVPYNAEVIYLSHQLPGQFLYFGIGVLFFLWFGRNRPLNLGGKFKGTYVKIALWILILSGIYFSSSLTLNSLTLRNVFFAAVCGLLFFVFMSVESLPSRTISCLGKISYSIYLWHYPLLAISAKIKVLNYVSLPVYSIIFAVMLILISSFSYYFIEEGGMRMKGEIINKS